jgi:hypothetical protein
MDRPLGRLEPTDDRHIIRYAATRSTLPLLPKGVVVGWNWYTAFDDPHLDADGNWWIVDPKRNDWGRIRGGHAVCLKPPGVRDNRDWWGKYNQFSEGACAGFAMCRERSLSERRFFDGFTHYHKAQEIDEWPGTDYDGTSVRAAADVARLQGMYRLRRGETTGPFPDDGIEQNRWCLTVEEMAYCLDPESGGLRVLNLGYFVPLNSWGDDPRTGYPHFPRISVEHAYRLTFREDGEATFITDRPAPPRSNLVIA